MGCAACWCAQQRRHRSHAYLPWYQPASAHAIEINQTNRLNGGFGNGVRAALDMTTSAADALMERAAAAAMKEQGFKRS
jgi:hypothetical protein